MLQEPFGRFARAMQNEALAPYKTHLARHRAGQAAKRALDVFAALVCLLIPLPLYLAAAVAVKCTSPGPVFYRQLRVGRMGRPFWVLKFRTMRVGADRSGEITVGSGDVRITAVGKVLRASNFDEFPQFWQVLMGEMSIIGVRPEVPHYVEHYTPEDFATLLLRPGMTSPVAIAYRHENDLLAGAADPEDCYIHEILPAKMAINREYVRGFSFGNDWRILGRTFRCLFEKDELLEQKRHGGPATK
ncbi:sugar transferase [Ethanoligenens harbinense YUAN-3]|uniref:Sugar transferase n=2 Tax=Ethanoligenens harbinense TaxID=253239 RepID=E6U9Y1_ETHHY|nr:sugar transferase [Ethanoligenens harbinense]ADU26247.1 sugar transferase [Ethanoligenens harbinense YUAN-3]